MLRIRPPLLQGSHHHLCRGLSLPRRVVVANLCVRLGMIVWRSSDPALVAPTSAMTGIGQAQLLEASITPGVMAPLSNTASISRCALRGTLEESRIWCLRRRSSQHPHRPPSSPGAGQGCLEARVHVRVDCTPGMPRTMRTCPCRRSAGRPSYQGHAGGEAVERPVVPFSRRRARTGSPPGIPTWPASSTFLMKGSDAIGLRMIRSGFFDMIWSTVAVHRARRSVPWGASSAMICTAPEASRARLHLVVHLDHHRVDRRLPSMPDLERGGSSAFQPAQAAEGSPRVAVERRGDIGRKLREHPLGVLACHVRNGHARRVRRKTSGDVALPLATAVREGARGGRDGTGHAHALPAQAAAEVGRHFPTPIESCSFDGDAPSSASDLPSRPCTAKTGPPIRSVSEPASRAAVHASAHG